MVDRAVPLRYQMIPKGSNFQDSCSTSPRQRVGTGVSSLSGRREVLESWNHFVPQRRERKEGWNP